MEPKLTSRCLVASSLRDMSSSLVRRLRKCISPSRDARFTGASVVDWKETNRKVTKTAYVLEESQELGIRTPESPEKGRSLRNKVEEEKIIVGLTTAYYLGAYGNWFYVASTGENHTVSESPNMQEGSLTQTAIWWSGWKKIKVIHEKD